MSSVTFDIEQKNLVFQRRFKKLIDGATYYILRKHIYIFIQALQLVLLIQLSYRLLHDCRYLNVKQQTMSHNYIKTYATCGSKSPM